jgi:hypothetical protein
MQASVVEITRTLEVVGIRRATVSKFRRFATMIEQREEEERARLGIPRWSRTHDEKSG